VLSAACIATAVAQTVYSVNAVGFVNVDLKPGFNMVANPLDATANTVAGLFGTALPEGAIVYKYASGTGFSVNAFEFGEWGQPTQTLNPGEGAFVFIPGTTAAKVTFVGEVKQGHLVTPIPAGFSIKASQVPQEAQLDTILKFPVAEGDQIYLFKNATGSYSTHSFEFGEWNIPPVPKVGEAFFVSKLAATDWVRDFSVNQ
jgi:hypothetical protein